MKCPYPQAKFSEGAERVISRVLEKHRHNPQEQQTEILANALTALDLLLALAHDDAASKKSEWTALGIDSMNSLLNIEQMAIKSDAVFPSAKDAIDRAAALTFGEIPQFDTGESPCEAEIARRHLLAACIELLPELCQTVLEISGKPGDIVKKLVFPWNPPRAETPTLTMQQMPFTIPNPAAFPEVFSRGPQPNQAFLEVCYKVMDKFSPDTFETDYSDYVLSIANRFWASACEKNQPIVQTTPIAMTAV